MDFYIRSILPRSSNDKRNFKTEISTGNIVGDVGVGNTARSKTEDEKWVTYE